MNDQIKNILDAEEQRKNIIKEAQGEIIEIDKSAQNDISSYEKEVNDYIKNLRREKEISAEKDSERVYKEVLETEREKVLRKKASLKSQIEEMETNIIKEILNKWLS